MEQFDELYGEDVLPQVIVDLEDAGDDANRFVGVAPGPIVSTILALHIVIGALRKLLRLGATSSQTNGLRQFRLELALKLHKEADAAGQTTRNTRRAIVLGHQASPSQLSG